MSEVKKVRVKLAARCLVDGVECEKGDVVLIDEKIAESFGEVQGAEKSPAPKADK